MPMEILIVVLLAFVVVAGAATLLLLRSLRADVRSLRDRIEENAGKEQPPDPAGPVADAVGERVALARDAVLERLDSVRGLVEELAGREPAVPNVAEEVEPLLGDVVDALEARVRRAVEDLEHAREGGVAEALARELREDGFREVRILAEPAYEGERTRVVVAARREGMTYKGPVYLRGSRVEEHRLSPSYPMFP
jgi:hypothetical protein